MLGTASAGIGRFPFYVFIVVGLLIGRGGVSVSATPVDPRPQGPRSHGPDPLDPLPLAILALPTGVLYATHIFGVREAKDSSPNTAVNTGDFLYGAYGRRAFPTTAVAMPSNGTDSTPRAEPLLAPSCADVSSLRYYAPSTAFLFPVPPSQQKPTRDGGPPADVGGPRAIINGSCRLPGTTQGEYGSVSQHTAAAPIVVSLRDRPGALPLSLQGPVAGVSGNIAESMSTFTGIEASACTLLSERWWAVRDLRALRAAMPPPPPPPSSAAQHQQLTLVAAYAQATADGSTSDDSASFPVSAYGRTCLQRGDALAVGGTRNVGQEDECGGQAVTVPVYALTGLVLAYAYLNDTATEATAATTNFFPPFRFPAATNFIAATVFIGGMPYSSSDSSLQPVTPVLFFGAPQYSGLNLFANVFAAGFTASPSISVVQPFAAYDDNIGGQYIAGAPPSMLNVIPNTTGTCPQTMADSIAPRWAWTASADYVYASSCAAFIAAGNFVSLTGMPPGNGPDFGLWLSDYLLLTIRPPSGSSTNDGAWLFPADVVLSDLFDGLSDTTFFGFGDSVNASASTASGSRVVSLVPPQHSGVYQHGLFSSTTAGFAIVTLAPYAQDIDALPQTSNPGQMILWAENDESLQPFPLVCPWRWQGSDYNRPRDLCLKVGGHTHCLGPGTLRTVAVSFAPSAGSSSESHGPLLTTLPINECVLLGQLTAYVSPASGGFMTDTCNGMVAPPLPRDHIGYASFLVRSAAGVEGVNSDPTCGHPPPSNSSCPRWPSPFPIVGATLPLNDQGPPPLDQTSFLTNEEAWCAFSQYIAAAPTGPTMGVSFLCSADRKTVFVVTCGGEHFSWNEDVDFDAPSQSPPAAAPSWSVLWDSLVQSDDVNASRTRPPYYAGLGGVPLMAFDAINDPSGFRFYCSACTSFIEAGEAPLPYAAVAIAALKDALLIALAVWIMSFPRLQHAASAVVAWLSALVAPFSDPTLARRLNCSIAETLRSGDEVTATQLAQTSRALAALGAPLGGQGARAQSQEYSRQLTDSQDHEDERQDIPSGPAAPHATSPASLSTARSFEAFLLFYVLRGCQRTVKVARLEQWASCLPPPPDLVSSVHAEEDAARFHAALEITHHLRAMRLAWASFPLEHPGTPRDNGSARDGSAAGMRASPAQEDPSPPPTPLHAETRILENCSRAANGDTTTHSGGACHAALYGPTRALWASLDSHGLLVPVTFADTVIDHVIAPPVWLMLLHLLFCVVDMIIILVTVVRAHELPCRNAQDIENTEGHTICVLWSGWYVYQTVFFRYINSTTSVSLIVNGIIRVLYSPQPPPALDDAATFFGSADAALVLRACREANRSAQAEVQARISPRSEDGSVVHADASSPSTPLECPREEDHLHTPLPSEEKLMNPVSPQGEGALAVSLAADEAMVAVLRRGHRHNVGALALIRRCLCDRFVQFGVLLPLPVLLTHALVGAVLYAWVTVPVIGLLVLVAVAAHRLPHRGQVHPLLASLNDLSSANFSKETKRKEPLGGVAIDIQRGKRQHKTPKTKAIDDFAMPMAADNHSEWLLEAEGAKMRRPRHRQSIICVVAAHLMTRVAITLTCVLLCQTTVNWMVLAYTGGGGNRRLAYSFEAFSNDLYAQVQGGTPTVPNTFLFRHRFPPPPALNSKNNATAGTAAAVERLQDAQYVTYLGILVREFEARSFACTLEMLAATVDGALQTLSVLF